MRSARHDWLPSARLRHAQMPASSYLNSNEGPGVKSLGSHGASSSVVSRPCLLNFMACAHLCCSPIQTFLPGPKLSCMDEDFLAGRVMELEKATVQCCELKAIVQISLRLRDGPTDAAGVVFSLICRCFELPAVWISLQFLLFLFVCFFSHFQRPFFIHRL